MMSIEMFYLAVAMLCLVGVGASWYMCKKEYDKGFIEAIQMHNEGRLTYNSYFDDEGIEMLDIQVKPYED